MRPLAAVGLGACGAVLTAALVYGCASSPASHGGPPPGAPPAPATSLPQGLPPGAVVGTTAEPAQAAFDIRFAMTLPSSSRFNFKDRDLSFYFRPTPEVLNMQVENLQASPVWIDWDRSVFRDIVGRTFKVAHSTTRWGDRYSVQAPTQILSLQNFSDYMVPMDYLLDPAGADYQLHRPIVPTDNSAPQYSSLEFGVDLVFLVQDQPRNYSFRFKVASVIPHTR
jgi:hypothetical protein